MTRSRSHSRDHSRHRSRSPVFLSPSPPPASPTLPMDYFINNFLDQSRGEMPDELHPLLLKIEDYWERKLWHELTEALLELFNHDGSKPIRLDYYNLFISTFAGKISQLKLVDLSFKAASQCKDKNERLTFLEQVATKVNNPSSQDAYVYALTSVANLRLELDDHAGAQRDLEKAEQILDGFDGVEQVVHADFYRVYANLYKRQANFTSYYRTALLYLACVDVDKLAAADRHTRAKDLALAALVSNDIYNFGELLLHPVLDGLAPPSSSELENLASSSSVNNMSEGAWLRALLFAFNAGDLSAYERLAPRLRDHPLLRNHDKHLRQKILLAALTEAVFRRPPHDRDLAFDTVAAETRVGPDAVEHIIMRALSLGLLRGTIDQVARVAHINWVQPKVLDMQQLAKMRELLRDWNSNINDLGNWIEQSGQDVWAA